MPCAASAPTTTQGDHHCDLAERLHKVSLGIRDLLALESSAFDLRHRWVRSNDAIERPKQAAKPACEGSSRMAGLGGYYSETSFAGVRLGKVTTARPLSF